MFALSDPTAAVDFPPVAGAGSGQRDGCAIVTRRTRVYRLLATRLACATRSSHRLYCAATVIPTPRIPCSRMRILCKHHVLFLSSSCLSQMTHHSQLLTHATIRVKYFAPAESCALRVFEFPSNTIHCHAHCPVAQTQARLMRTS